MHTSKAKGQPQDEDTLALAVPGRVGRPGCGPGSIPC